MTKRFIEFLTQNVDDGKLNCGFQDITSGKWYYTLDEQNAKSICEVLNELNDENQAVKDILKELNEIDEFWDSALLQDYITNIANVVGVELDD